MTMGTPSPVAAALLVDELIEEVILYLPPEDPESLIHAALVPPHRQH